MDPMILATLAGAVLAISVGSARLFVLLLTKREADATRAIREASLVSRARAELAERDYAISMLDQEDMSYVD